MTIEPVSSVMSLQAQGNTQTTPKTTSTSGESTTEYNPTTVNEAQKVDQTTKIVENAQSTDQGRTASEQNQNTAAQQQVTNEQIRKAVEKINKSMMAHSEAVFGIHEATNRVTIKIVDKDTKEVVKELPPEKTLDMIAKVWEMAGILVDERR